MQLTRTTATYCAVLFSGLFAGFLITVLILELSLRDARAGVYTQVRLVELEHLGGLATVLLVPAVLATATVVFSLFRQPGRGRWLALVAMVLLLTALVISASISVPINTAQESWSVLAPPGNWADVRDRWQIAHAARTAAAVLAFLLLIWLSQQASGGSASTRTAPAADAPFLPTLSPMPIAMVPPPPPATT
jgi:hypothetical protein